MRFIFGLAVASGIWCGAANAQFQCPPGSVNVSSGYVTMCQCPDGSAAGISGCRSQYTVPAQPQGLRCGNGYCPYGTTCSRNGNFCLSQGQVDCGTYTCGNGNKCGSGNRCFPIDVNECGPGYCQPGLMCTSNKQCVDPEKTSNGPSGALGTLLAVFNLYADVTQFQRLLPSTSLSQSVKSQPAITGVSWSAIQSSAGTPGAAGLSPGSSAQAAASFNPFTNTYSIPSSASANNAAPSFAQPATQPGLQATIQATKPVSDNLKDVQTMPMQSAPSQQNSNTTWQSPDPFNTHCTGAIKC